MSFFQNEEARRAAFPVVEQGIFLAHAGVTVLPRCAADAMQAHAEARERSAGFALGLRSIPLAPEVEEALADLRGYTRGIGLERLIVRSSAEGEDAPQASCAGLLESVVCAPEDLASARDAGLGGPDAVGGQEVDQLHLVGHLDLLDEADDRLLPSCLRAHRTPIRWANAARAACMRS